MANLDVAVPLTPNDVHLWTASLTCDPDTLIKACALLSDDEIERADRFQREEHSQRFTMARCILRQLLAHYLSQQRGRTQDPSGIQFHYNRWGKPSICEENVDNALQFNLSHSQDVAIFGITQSAAIGVDLESLHREVDVEKIARRYFTQKEQTIVLKGTDAERYRAFYALWTRKEAYAKARGLSLATLLNTYDLSGTLNTKENSHFLPHDAEVGDSPWSLVELTPAEGFIASAVVDHHAPRVHVFSFQSA